MTSIKIPHKPTAHTISIKCVWNQILDQPISVSVQSESNKMLCQLTAHNVSFRSESKKTCCQHTNNAHSSEWCRQPVWVQGCWRHEREVWMWSILVHSLLDLVLSLSFLDLIFWVTNEKVTFEIATGISAAIKTGLNLRTTIHFVQPRKCNASARFLQNRG